ncbi:MAG: glycosyltransferase [Brevinematia bacterium]
MEPFISVCLPTYNNEKTIGRCLDTIFNQNYPKDKFEVIVVDGGSSDNTVQIVKGYKVILLGNPYRIEEKGRVIGVEKSRGDIIAFIDADNYLIDPDFFSKMVVPFLENPKVAISQPKYYVSEDRDDLFTKYLEVMAGDDPIAIYLGMFERWNYLFDTWTKSPIEVLEKKGFYEIVNFINLEKMPPIGSNGCFVRKEILLSVKYDPFIHTDVCYRILKKGFAFSIVDSKMVHKQDGKLSTFIRKKNRRLSRNYEELGREFYQKIELKDLVILTLKCVLLIPLLVDSFVGYFRKPSKAWLIHPFLTELTFWNAVFQTLKKIIRRGKFDLFNSFR